MRTLDTELVYREVQDMDQLLRAALVSDLGEPDRARCARHCDQRQYIDARPVGGDHDEQCERILRQRSGVLVGPHGSRSWTPAADADPSDCQCPDRHVRVLFRPRDDDALGGKRQGKLGYYWPGGSEHKTPDADRGQELHFGDRARTE